MKDICGYLFRLLIGSSFAIVLLSPHASSAATCEKPIAKVVSAQGSVEAQRVGETQWQQVKLNDTFCPGDKLRAKRRSRAEVALAKSILRLNANTTLTLKNIKENNTALIDLLQGAAYFFSLAPKSLEVVTPSAIAAVRGTEFFISVEDERTLLTIFEGEVLASNPTGSLALANGQSAVANRGQAPVQRVVARPQDAVRWTLYYPPVIDINPEDFQGVNQQSIQSYRKGDLKAAFDRLENLPEVQDPRFFTYLASLELSVGRVDAADKNIQQALSLDSKNSDAIALQSIIALAQNEKDKAFSKAQKAVQSDPKSANAQIALSYSQQARFDLEGALTSAQIAVQLEPQNALAWARLAELWSGHGNLDKTLEAAQKAISLNPNLSRTQTVLGFAHLTREDADKARVAFQKAIELDQGDPLPKLGLGLAKIRKNELAEGRGDLEEAVSLDPNNSLMRSYLGKAYYEEKRSDKASEQFTIAKKKDPKDPTPYLYDAIEKQTTNRPVEALHDMQTAIELNDNRAPFRSKLLLDSDLASRSAAIGRIYSDLGFQNRALLEGWLSVGSDPSNYSAHRFLADSYSVLQRHEIARVSELLQSQLLQPINMTPVQPRLGESNLFLISSQGPGNLSFNEFNPLFNKDGLAAQISGVVGENDTFAGEGIISGIFDKASFSVGYSKFDTNGWRPDANHEDDLATAFGQYQLTPKTSVQVEFRFRESTTGDVQLQFFTDGRWLDRSITTRDKSARVGFHHKFAPGSDLIGNFAYKDNLNKDLFKVAAPAPPGPPPELTKNIESDNEAFSGELQYLHRSEYFNFVVGGGYFDINGTETTVDSFGGFTICIPTFPPNPPFPPCLAPGPPFPVVVPPRTNLPKVLDTDRSHLNGYLYTYIKPLKNLTFTLGVSADIVETDDPSSGEPEQVNPKGGVIWEPFEGTTLRAAAFRSLKRTLLTNQTLEPTQVAGFNQFFDDLTSSDVWRYGVGIDQRFSKSWYAGAEYTYRSLDVPFSVGSGSTFLLKETNWNERVARAYLFWTPHNWLALTAEYRYEKLERDAVPIGAKEADTHWVPLGLSFYHPSGFSASFKGTWVDQKGKFNKQNAQGTFIDASDTFWLADANIRYRLPKRYGFLTLGAANLFDEDFRHFDTNFGNPRIQPARTLFASVTLNFR